MKQFLITIAGVFLGLVLFFVILPVMLIAAAAAGSGGPATPAQTVLMLDLREDVTDQAPSSPFGSFGGGGVAVVDLVRRLEAAESDSHVKGLMIRAPESGLAPAHAEEIRQAIIDFQASGRFVIAHAQGFENPTLSNYVAVSAADEIWMQNASDFTATGLVAETLFMGGLFERFGIITQFEQFFEYKNAADTYTQRDYTAAHREATTSLLTGVYDAFLAAVAVDRDLQVEPLKAILDTAPLSSAQAMAAKLIDKVGMPEEAMDAALERAGGVDSAEFVELSAYQIPEGTGPTIAIVGGEGAIVGGPGGSDPFSSEQAMNGDVLAAAVREATDDEDVRAIVLRVSSPGGSAIASEQIWAAVERAQAEGKPVVVSMGAYAASGGYYVSAGADEIVAMPSTITGSIGVLGGKLVINDTLNRYTGANISEIQIGGPYASAFSAATPFTNSQREGFRAAMERVYTTFTTVVAEGRSLPLARVQEIARGRVWTGTQAVERGLVDEVGGLRVAIAKARTRAGIAEDASIRVQMYPAAEDPVAALASLFGASADAARAAVVLGRVLGDDRLSALLARMEAAQSGAALAEEPVRVR